MKKVEPLNVYVDSAALRSVGPLLERTWPHLWRYDRL